VDWPLTFFVEHHHQGNTMHESLRNSNHDVAQRIRSSSTVRSGSISPKAIIAIVIFLIMFGALRYATMAGPEIKVVETKRVNGKDLGGLALNMKALKSILSSEATGGVAGISGLSAHFRTAPPGLREKPEDGSEGPETEGTEGIEGKLINLQPDANGELLFVRLRLSRDYLEKQGKISNLMAVVSTPDIQLARAGGGQVDPIFLLSGLREQTTTPRGPATQFNFGGGNTYTSYKPVPAELWLATGQVKQAQELAGSVEIVCLFGRPPGDGALSLQILGTPNVSLQ
jgi:hypothetical protein